MRLAEVFVHLEFDRKLFENLDYKLLLKLCLSSFIDSLKC